MAVPGNATAAARRDAGQMRRRLLELEAEILRLRGALAAQRGPEPAAAPSTRLYREMAQMLDISADAILSTDDRGLIRRFNRGAEVVFGYRASEVIGRPLDILLPERFRKSHRRHMAAFAHAPESSRLKGERGKLYGLRRDGTEFPAEISIARLDSGGHRVFTAILRDVSCHAGESSPPQREDMPTSPESDRLPAMVIRVGPDGRVRSANRTAERWYACSARQLVGRPLAELFPAKAYRVIGRRVEAALAGRGAGCELDVDHPDGRTRRLAVDCLPCAGSDGTAAGMFLLAVDRTGWPRPRSRGKP